LMLLFVQLRIASAGLANRKQNAPSAWALR